MPEIKNTFLKSKMNKDLDARIIPNGEYRDAQNINISRSEGADVGDLENILSNNQLTNLKNSIADLEVAKFNVLYPGDPVAKGSITLDNLEVIGFFMDTSKDSIYLFLTDYTDSSADQLSNFAPANLVTFSGAPSVGTLEYQGAACYIVSYNLITNTSLVLVSGNFLNFSKTHLIINVNVIENLLFWTDNRNQPRKINLNTASLTLTSQGSWETWFNSNGVTMANTNPYYYNEDHISVSKFAPYECFKFLDTSNNGTLISKSEKFLAPHIITDASFNASADLITIIGNYTGPSATNSDIKAGDQLVVLAPFISNTSTTIEEDQKYIVETTSPTTPASSNQSVRITTDLTQQVDAGSKIAIQRLNPDYDENYVGDKNLLKDKFAKFSYRFKYDDDEYSLMAPFTQAAFIPEQFGCFVNDDEQNALESGVVSFMENMVDNVKLNLILPYAGNEMSEKLKVKELQILVKNSDELAVRVIEDVNVNALGSTTNYEYNYLSSKAIKTLPEAELIRVSDQVPVRALTQEVVGNRVVYGNFIDTHSSLDKLNYQLQSTTKSISNDTDPTTGLIQNLTTRELPTHSLKQNRSYQVGFVLFDRYGRASSVMLNDALDVANPGKNSTIYLPYKSPSINNVKYFGDLLQLTLLEPIPSSSSISGYPGLYSATNPLGYYTYRVVVKQQEQSYYNVYTPGALSGNLTWNVTTEDNSGTLTTHKDSRLPSFSNINSISLLNLFGDNINKVPRELNEVNGNDTTFGSETLLYNRVNPGAFDSSTSTRYNTQSEVSGKGEEVISIEPFKNLGEWTTTKGDLYPSGDKNSKPQPWYPHFVENTNDYKFYDIFYNAQSNPFIATIETNFRIGATPSYGSQGGIENSWRNLGVFETKPTTSALDIYYETSTSGTIEDLNNSQVASGIPVGLRDSAGNNTFLGQDLQYLQTESMLIGEDVTLPFSLVDSSGTILTTSSSAEIEAVNFSPTAGVVFNFPLTIPLNLFTIVTVSPGVFKIKTNSLFQFTSNSPNINNYTFILKFTDTSSATPLFTNLNLSLGNCRLQNDSPVFLQQPNSDFGEINVNDPIFAINNTGTPSYPNNVTVSNGSELVASNLSSGIASSFSQQLVFSLKENPNATGNSNKTGQAERPAADPNYLFSLNGGILEPSSNFPYEMRYAYGKTRAAITYFYDLQLIATDANGAGLSTISNSFKGSIKINFGQYSTADIQLSGF